MLRPHPARISPYQLFLTTPAANSDQLLLTTPIFYWYKLPISSKNIDFQRLTVTGFLNLNKPAGLTSHDCVARVRRLLRLKRVGHAGTLDPAATGVLPIALSKATRLLQFLRQDKAYHGTIRLGVTTTTDDTQGEVISTQIAGHLNLDTVRSALKQFEGKIQGASQFCK
jgi:tRNA U55 pseudouridine synthase TruB